MYKVVKCFEFEAAHRLIETCTEKCKRIHGHTYKLEVELTTEKLNENQMVVDFTEVSKQVKEAIIEEFDHCLILKAEGNILEYMPGEFLYDTNKRQDHNIVYLRKQPTAEYMCWLFFTILVDGYELPVTRIRLWETSDSYAEYIKD